MSYRIEMLSTFAVALVIIFSFSTSAFSTDEDSVKIIAHSSFLDSEEKLNVVGTVRNTGDLPVHVTIGLKVQDQTGSRIEHQQTFGSTIWPLNDSPFKFVIDSGTAGLPFIASVKEVATTHITDMIILNYTSMAIGNEKAFIGTVTNNAPFDIYNVSVFASVRDENASQLDSVRSNVIPVLRANEKQQFIVSPEAAIKSKVYYYSCAGLDLDAPITTIDAGGGEFIAYNLNAAAQVNAMRYQNETDSIVFAVRPYGPAGGTVSLMIPQASQDPRLTVTLDGNLHKSDIRADGKTIYIDFFVPQGQHEVQIQKVTGMQQIPSAPTR